MNDKEQRGMRRIGKFFFSKERKQWKWEKGGRIRKKMRLLKLWE